ncbi:MORC family CW-type zinc finger protein 3 isoform X2 [Austrofundulus limnaeus]|uniref:MORC family CW-type zinc finger protein 3 isoform X2 n=1 Tax=Austrofundulus limnaeus TaxID=52670 RepID=A0A2I4B272_AUSLI|nr:PREDICTED: MORC family CW-type zinc finger protein 3-like isoform X2 [Austrofundulus limnaeus]
MARLSEQGIRLSSMSPSFLNSNSTSHTWPFSAVAELLGERNRSDLTRWSRAPAARLWFWGQKASLGFDNAADPGVSAKQIWIDVVNEADQLCLTFTDNGSGMTPNKLHKMLSFGFTEKGTGKASHQAIGLYGNGFKSGSMRLGRDALIFTKNGGCQTVGMLSQTYLQNIKAQSVIVPIVPFNQQTKSLVVTEDSGASLAAILQHSILTSQEQILTHFDSIPAKKGTKILIWNIRRAKDGKTEIDFDADTTDFRLPEIQTEELRQGLRSSGSPRPEQNVPDMYYSLRAYISILYLKPRTQVILRGRKVLAKLVSKSLTHIEHDVYKPQFSKEKMKVTFGFNPKRKEHFGIMMYHKNRLIKAYEKVGCQLKASGQRVGIGVVGIIECDFLKPAHNKQDFEYTKEYRLTLGALGLKLNDYWKEVTEKRAREREFQALENDDKETEECADTDPLWLQCEECLKWRSVPANHYKVAPESWNCNQNPNSRYRSCSAPEETEESEELLTPSYQKNHKKLELSKRRKQEKSLKVSQVEEHKATRQILPRISSDPLQPSSSSTQTPEPRTLKSQKNTQEERLTDEDTDTRVPPDSHKGTRTNDDDARSATRSDERTSEKDTAGEEKNESGREKTHVELDQRIDNKKRDAPMELEEEQHTDMFSRKRKPESFFTYETKKHWRGSQPDSEKSTEDLHPGTQTNTFKKSNSQVEKSNALQQTSTSHTWTHSPLATQTVVVSPLSRTEGPQGRTLPPEGGDREAKVQKLASLEREVQRLRSLLGLEVPRTTQGTMTAADEFTDTPKEGLEGKTATTTSREVGCQTAMAECSTSATEPDAEQENKSRKEKTESQSKMKISESDSCDDGRSPQQNLQDIRNNVVVLLTALLPQLDLAGISMETADVDNILQQIIEVNALKL